MFKSSLYTHRDTEGFSIGERVIYLPAWANGDKNHKDAKQGVIKIFNIAINTCFVKFDDGRTAACCLKSLIKI